MFEKGVKGRDWGRGGVCEKIEQDALVEKGGEAQDLLNLGEGSGR